MDINKTVRLGSISAYAGPCLAYAGPCSVFCKIEFKDGRLSITGVEGPLQNGNAIGGCGQINMSLSLDEIKAAPGWDKDTLEKFFSIWDRWHLNDLKAGSQAQEDWLRKNPIPKEAYVYPRSHYEVAAKRLADTGLNPDAEGYSYGHAWKREEVPKEVVEWLQALPDTDIKPAWV